MKPVDVKTNIFAESSKEINDKDPKSKLVALLEYQNIKVFLQEVTLQICLKKFLWLRKLKNTGPWVHDINDLNGEETVGTILENKLQKIIQKEFRIEKVIKRKGDKL